MPLLLKILLPAFTGAVVAGASMVGLVYSQTQAPSDNPASQPVISYGTR